MMTMTWPCYANHGQSRRRLHSTFSSKEVAFPPPYDVAPAPARRILLLSRTGLFTTTHHSTLILQQQLNFPYHTTLHHTKIIIAMEKAQQAVNSFMYVIRPHAFPSHILTPCAQVQGGQE